MHEPQRHYTLADYFSIEEMSATKHEFFRGEIFAMAGASVQHNRIAVNLLTALNQRLRQGRCSVFGSDLRIATPSGLYTYPDAAVICGKIELASKAPDTAMNPVVLVEILSDATREYDRGEKFDLYKTIPSLREYLLIEPRSAAVEHFVRERNSWSVAKVFRRGAKLRLSSLKIEVPIAELYRGAIRSR